MYRVEVVVVVGPRLLDTSQPWSSSCGRNGRGWSSPPIGRCGPPCRGDGGWSRQPLPRPPPRTRRLRYGGWRGAGGARRGETPRGDSRPPPRPLPSRYGHVGEGATKRTPPPPSVLALYARPIPTRGERRSTFPPSNIDLFDEASRRVSHHPSLRRAILFRA